MQLIKNGGVYCRIFRCCRKLSGLSKCLAGISLSGKTSSILVPALPFTGFCADDCVFAATVAERPACLKAITDLVTGYIHTLGDRRVEDLSWAFLVSAGCAADCRNEADKTSEEPWRLVACVWAVLLHLLSCCVRNFAAILVLKNL